MMIINKLKKKLLKFQIRRWRKLRPLTLRCGAYFFWVFAFHQHISLTFQFDLRKPTSENHGIPKRLLLPATKAMKFPTTECGSFVLKQKTKGASFINTSSKYFVLKKYLWLLFYIISYLCCLTSIVFIF